MSFVFTGKHYAPFANTWQRYAFLAIHSLHASIFKRSMNTILAICNHKSTICLQIAF